MNGLGNDFVVVDARDGANLPDGARIKTLGDRNTGIGFDQFIVIAPSARADATMRIFNADGGEVEACGNAARCVAALLLDETGKDEIHLDSDGGLMAARFCDTGVAVDMGPPRFAAADIPLADPDADPLGLTIPGFSERYGQAACVNVGNPHAVFFVEDAIAVPLVADGAALERHAAFPARANISFVTITSRTSATVRVFERGVGPTRACGTAACAVAAVGHRLGILDARATIHLPGGALTIDVASPTIIMEGPFALDYFGEITATGFTPQRPAAL